MDKRILLTAFRHTSSQILLETVTEYSTILLPNDKVKDSAMATDIISKEEFDYIISIGQKPNIKDKLYIETTARDGNEKIITDFDCRKLVDLFAQAGLPCKLSDNAGTSYCNQLYLKTMRCIMNKHLHSKMVFVHIPFEKNIEDFEGFRAKFMNVVSCLWEGSC